MHLRDLIKVQEYEETEFLKLIEEEQDKTRKPIDIVDVSKKFYLKQLSKKSKINTIFGTSSTVITIIVLVISAILLRRFYAKKYGRTKYNVSHFNRIDENIQTLCLASLLFESIFCSLTIDHLKSIRKHYTYPYFEIKKPENHSFERTKRIV